MTSQTLTVSSLRIILNVPGCRYAEFESSALPLKTSILDPMPQFNRSPAEVIFAHCANEVEKAEKILARAKKLKAALAAHMKANPQGNPQSA